MKSICVGSESDSNLIDSEDQQCMHQQSNGESSIINGHTKTCSHSKGRHPNDLDCDLLGPTMTIQTTAWWVFDGDLDCEFPGLLLGDLDGDFNGGFDEVWMGT
jgi:hypothetical protein